MLALERHRQMLDLLKKHGSVRTTEVAKTLGVTEETVRRDFEKLEAEGMLMRSHGGAVRLEAQRREFPVRERAAQNAGAKIQIARAAVAKIREGQTIFCDPSTTVQHLAEAVPDIPLTVVTNSLQIANLLADKPAVHVVLLGGNLMSSSLSCTGWAAEQTLNLYRIDSAFVSCRGIDPERGLSEATEEQARLKHRVVEGAESVYLLADSSKSGVASSYFYSQNSAVDVWITNEKPSPALEAALTAQGVRIELAS